MNFRLAEDNLRSVSKLIQTLIKVTRYVCVCVVDGDKVIRYMILRYRVKLIQFKLKYDKMNTVKIEIWTYLNWLNAKGPQIPVAKSPKQLSFTW